MTHRGTGRKHVQGQHVKCKHAESHDAHRSGAHKANVKYKPKYMSRVTVMSEPAQSVRVHLRDGGWGESSSCVNKDEAKKVSRNMEEGDEAWTGDSGEENADKPVFLENESSDYTAVFGRLPESLRAKPLQRPVFTAPEGSTHSRTRHT